MKTTTIARIGNTERNVGIDVGKSTLDIHIHELDPHWQVPDTLAGIEDLLSQLNRYKLTRVLAEATGGYECALAEACVVKGIPIIVVQPIQIRQFTKAQGVLAKTDKINARLIAHSVFS